MFSDLSVSYRFKLERQPSFAVIKFLQNFLLIAPSDIDQSITIAARILHLFRQLPPFCSKYLDSYVRKFRLELFDFSAGWYFQYPLILERPQDTTKSTLVFSSSSLPARLVPQRQIQQH